jgi:hypothetical protein
MALHGFESLGDVLKRIGVKFDTTTAPVAEAPPAPTCARCMDSGYLRRDVPATDRDFGRLVECPCGTIQTRRMTKIWASSEIPPTMRHYSLASFALRSGKQALVDDVRASWDEGTRWLLLTGPVGLGKTGIAVSLLLEAMHAGSGGLYVVTPSFLSRIRATYTRVKDGEVDEMDVLGSVISAPLLVLDDVGKVALSEWGQEKLFTVINERYLAGRRTIVTSNLDVEGERSLEDHLWPATWDRIRGSSDIFRLTGESLR